jgi:hypothetical protein
MATKRPPHVIENLRRLHEESRALLESIADRLPPQHVDQYRTLSDVGEWRELVESLCASLVKGQVPVTPAERDALAGVLARLTRPKPGYDFVNGPEGTLAALHVVWTWSVDSPGTAMTGLADVGVPVRPGAAQGRPHRPRAQRHPDAPHRRVRHKPTRPARRSPGARRPPGHP